MNLPMPMSKGSERLGSESNFRPPLYSSTCLEARDFGATKWRLRVAWRCEKINAP
jgi:hypothetical protein